MYVSDLEWEVACAHQSKKPGRLTITRLLRFIDGTCAEKSQTGSTDRIFLTKKAAQDALFLAIMLGGGR